MRWSYPDQAWVVTSQEWADHALSASGATRALAMKAFDLKLAEALRETYGMKRRPPLALVEWGKPQLVQDA